eukprot:CAMPEP_0185730068 /NCGR_PEP_ID=MMETSP1171-20130828/8393_1 /TAXON_ID=374046 /ORGANISM="Helicotheca tamensis, Strain CCMP826" /LENGTH=50 /DNA_ID=CAMNT_0028399051 /DNA_START=45 /DNA_END=193 /DNA_ORIENTATION=+
MNTITKLVILLASCATTMDAFTILPSVKTAAKITSTATTSLEMGLFDGLA